MSRSLVVVPSAKSRFLQGLTAVGIMQVMSGVTVFSFLDVATTWCIIGGTLAKMESWNYSVRLQKFSFNLI